MHLERIFPVPIPLTLGIGIIQGANIGTWKSQALIGLLDGHLLDLATVAVAYLDRRLGTDVRTTALNLDEHLRFVAIDAPDEARAAGELVAGSLVESEDRSRLGIKAGLKQNLGGKTSSDISNFRSKAASQAQAQLT